ncbi:hypothetical protein [Andreprevotia lacus]|nr:hypothetical protein [Andreprevotia lacus]
MGLLLPMLTQAAHGVDEPNEKARLDTLNAELARQADTARLGLAALSAQTTPEGVQLVDQIRPAERLARNRARTEHFLAGFDEYCRNYKQMLLAHGERLKQLRLTWAGLQEQRDALLNDIRHSSALNDKYCANTQALGGRRIALFSLLQARVGMWHVQGDQIRFSQANDTAQYQRLMGDMDRISTALRKPATP